MESDSCHSERREKVSLAVALLLRVPRIGNGKRRLASSLGDKLALDVYSALCSHVLSACSTSTRTLALHDGFDNSHNTDLINKHLMPTHCQHDTLINIQCGSTLGQRVHNALLQAFSSEGFTYAAVCASDVPSLSASDISQCNSLLQHYDAVLGPSPDGGFYILALARPIRSSALDQISWSTDRARTSCRNVLEAEGFSVAPDECMRSLMDIDSHSDLFTWLSLGNDSDVAHNAEESELRQCLCSVLSNNGAATDQCAHLSVSS